MAQKQTAIVVVNKSWIDTAVRHLVNNGQTSRSTGETHLLIGDVEDASDHRGLWLKNILTNQLTRDGSPITMKLMIPWSFIVGVGLADDDLQGKMKPGFNGGEQSQAVGGS